MAAGGDGVTAVNVDGGLRAVLSGAVLAGRGYAGGKISACCLSSIGFLSVHQSYAGTS